VRVLLVPGFAQTSGVWAATIAQLSVDAAALEVPIESDFAATALALGKRGGRGVYVGYSMGGRLVLYLALEHPELVASLVLVSSSPGIADAGKRQARAAADLGLADWIDSHSREEFLDHWTQQPTFQDVLPESGRQHRLSSPAEVADQLRRLGQGTQPSLWDRLAELQMPVSFVVGENDSTYLGIAERAAELVSGQVEIRVVPRAGHALVHHHSTLLADIIAGVGDPTRGPG